MAKKPPLSTRPKIEIPVDRQTPDQTFAPRVRPPVTRFPPPPAPAPEPPKENPQ